MLSKFLRNLVWAMVIYAISFFLIFPNEFWSSFNDISTYIPHFSHRVLGGIYKSILTLRMDSIREVLEIIWCDLIHRVSIPASLRVLLPYVQTLEINTRIPFQFHLYLSFTFEYYYSKQSVVIRSAFRGKCTRIKV